MKKIISIFLLIAMTFSLCSCFGSGKNTTELNLYFKNAETNELIVEKVKYTESQNTVDMAKFAMMKLTEGPLKATNARTIPEGVTFSSISVKNESATVDFSVEFNNFTGNDGLLARFAVVRTLCDIPGITSVLIKIDGKPLISNATGKEIGVLSVNDIVSDIQTNIVQTQETTKVKLYFSTQDATALKVEERKVTTQEALSIEKTILTELLKGPTSPELISVIPAGTKLLSVETKEGVCYVNFSGEFVSKFPGGTGMLTVYSVVNSLCNLNSTSAVQILIEGEKGQTFGDYVFDEPISPNLNLVQKN